MLNKLKAELVELHLELPKNNLVMWTGANVSARLDRIDIHIEVPRVDYEKLSGDRVGESSAAIQARVIFNKNASQLMDHPRLSATPTCASGRPGNFASCRTKVRA